MKTTPEQRAAWLRLVRDTDAMSGIICQTLIEDIEEIEAKLAEYKATATLDPVIECPSCGLEISLAGEDGGYL